jgi:hypothetical protein
MNRPRLIALRALALIYRERLDVAWTVLRGRGHYLEIQYGFPPRARRFIGAER